MTEATALDAPQCRHI